MTDYSSMSDEELASVTGMQIPPPKAAPVSSAILSQESNGGKNPATSIDGAVGAAQITPDTFARYAKPGEKIDNPDDNMAVHHRIIQDLSSKTGGDPARIAVGYFSGPGNIAPADSDKPYVHDYKDGNGKSVSSYVSDVMGKMQKPTADSGQIKTDASVDTKPDYSKMSDEQLASLTGMKIPAPKIAAPSAPQAGAQNPPIDAQKGSMLASLKNQIDQAGSSPLGQTVGYGINSASDVMGPIAGMITGKQYKDQTPTPDLDTLGKQGFSKTSWPQIAGAVEESLMNSPPGKLLGIGAATPIGAVTGTGINKANEALESEGIPHQYSQAAEMALPFLAKPGMKAAGIDPADIYQKASDLKSQIQNLEIMKNQESGSPPPLQNLGNLLSDKATSYTSMLGLPKGAASPQAAPPPPPNPSSGAAGQPLLVPPKSWNNARDILSQVLKDENIDPNDVANNLEESLKSGKPLVALDVANKEVGGVQTQGKQLLALSKAAANMPGQGASMAGEVAARGINASDRIAEDFNKSISKSPFYDVKEDAIQQQQGSGDLYKQAHAANPSVNSPEINSILNTPAGKTALKNAVTTMQNNRSMVGVNDPDLVEQAALTGQYEPGNGGIASGLKLKTLDLVKQELWDLAEKQKNPITGRDTSDSRAIKGQMGSLTNELDKLDSTNQIDPNTQQPIPGTGLYAQARKAYSTGARQESAAEKGREFMSMDPEEISSFIKDTNTSDPEKLAFASGVRRAIQDRIDATNDGSNPINKIWKQNVRSRIQPLFPDAQSFNDFSKAMEHEQTMARVNNNFQAGSPTAPNLGWQGMMGKNPVDIAKSAMNPTGAAVSYGMDAMSKHLQKAAKNMSNETAAGIMRYLTTNDPQVWRDLAAQTKTKP